MNDKKTLKEILSTLDKASRRRVILTIVGFALLGVLVGTMITIIDEIEASKWREYYYKQLLWDVYDDYVIALRDIEATTDLIRAFYYAQYLPSPQKEMWHVEWKAKGSPEAYAEDAMEQLDDILKRLESIQWPEDFRDDVLQLKVYINELRGLVLQIQEIAKKNSLTRSDVEDAETLLDLFSSYNHRMYTIIKNI